MFQYFTTNQLLQLTLSLVLLVGSILLFEIKKSRLSLFFLFSGTLVLGCFMALLDPFLILWDEQYHALVAKHMMENPLKPTLYSDPVLGYDYTNWSGNYIWLHKQPLFLWQIALSLKVFGLNEFAVRFPSVLMHALIPLMISRIGKISINEKAGYIGAILFAVANFILELMVGRYSTDHNDIAFLFYITGSLWAWFEYQRSNKWQWLILIGLMSGGAVLVKWLVGLLIYPVWVISLCSSKEELLRLKTYKPIVICFIITCATFVPWQVYILFSYPQESSFEYEFNTKHFFVPVEGHNESTWFHFSDALQKIYGSGFLVPFLLLASLVVLYIKFSENKYRLVVFGSITIVYSFYTIAATKMPSYCVIVSPLIFLALGALLYALIELINKRITKPIIRGALSVTFVATVSFFLLDVSKIRHYHTMWKPKDNHNREEKLSERQSFDASNKNLVGNNWIVFNVSMGTEAHIPFMFYTNHIAYKFIPTKEQINVARTKGYRVAVFTIGNLPEYITSDKEITLLDLT